MPTGYTFQDAVSAIIKHRNDNPRFNLTTDPVAVAEELDNYNCAVLKNNPAWCEGVSPMSFRRPSPVRRLPVGGNIGAAGGRTSFFQNVNVGIKVWRDWFGDGKPVEKALAEKRAAVCVKCDRNIKGNILERFSAAAGKEILAVFNSLHDLDLHTSLDKELNVCSVCDCALKAKVWCPVDVFAPHMKKETIDALPSWCWISGELSKPAEKTV